MPSVDMTLESTVPPDQVRAALLDFGPDRPKLWPGITASLYEVYSVGETTADVKEGTKLPFATFWARERYDWSDPETVCWTVQESNFCAPGSFMAATIRRGEGGGSHVELHWERTGTSAVGKLMGRLVVLTKGKPVSQSFAKALSQLEAAPAASGA